MRTSDVVALGQREEPASAPALRAPFDVCATWLDLALHHLSDAQFARDARLDAWRNENEHSKSGALEWEFEASMQATVASAIAIDAFYAAVQTKVPLPQSLIDEWRDKQTPRCIRIADVFGEALSLDPSNAAGMRQTLTEVFRFRDAAIDPSGKVGVEILHPELGIAVEWRFAYFRYQNALLIVKATVHLIAELVASAHAKDAVLQAYIDALRPRVEPLQNAHALRPQTEKCGA